MTSVAPAWAPPGYGWQTKIDDERAVFRVRDGCLYNRHGISLDRHKAAPFRPVVEELARVYCAHPWLDLGLIGFRDASIFGASRGAVILFDLPDPRPGDNRPYFERREFLRQRLPVLDLIAGEVPVAGMAYRFEDYDHAGELFARTVNVPGVEGIVGRLLRSPYVFGEAQAMIRARWKRG